MPTLPQLRGSGTTSHINTNLVRPQDRATQTYSVQTVANSGRGVDSEIQAHERARRIEGELYDLRLQLDSQGVLEEDIEARVEAERKRLESQSQSQVQSQSLSQSSSASIATGPVPSLKDCDDLDY